MLVGDVLLVRNGQEMAAFQLSSRSADKNALAAVVYAADGVRQRLAGIHIFIFARPIW